MTPIKYYASTNLTNTLSRDKKLTAEKKLSAFLLYLIPYLC